MLTSKNVPPGQNPTAICGPPKKASWGRIGAGIPGAASRPGLRDAGPKSPQRPLTGRTGARRAQIRIRIRPTPERPRGAGHQRGYDDLQRSRVRSRPVGLAHRCGNRCPSGRRASPQIATAQSERSWSVRIGRPIPGANGLGSAAVSDRQAIAANSAVNYACNAAATGNRLLAQSGPSVGTDVKPGSRRLAFAPASWHAPFVVSGRSR
jgi:hypothetical protein